MDPQFASTITYKLWKDKGRNSISKMDPQFASTITYKLWEGKGKNTISKWICSLQAQSLTSCGKVKAETT
jgi:hypothetical protein